ncbi:MAG: hypothetical protein IT260_07805, partial [Saprospiraceae bacterium]|nr:hypothetical protein [Saprospiraceae bacterium]
MRFITVLLTLSLGLIHESLLAQPLSCGQAERWQAWLQQDPALEQRQAKLDNMRAQQLANGQPIADGSALYTIPVVVHIIHQNGVENISDAQVQQGIQHLNLAFANSGYYDHNDGVPTPFQFCLARRDPAGNATTGINRVVSPLTNMTKETEDQDLKNLIRWNPTLYANIWLVASINSLSSGAGVAAYATLPPAHGSSIDGIVIEAQWFGASEIGSGVTVHEMGHYLGLYHTFEGGCTNDNCNLDGDRVCDTPPDQSTASLPCNAVENSCQTDTDSGFATDQNDMTINYMDYANLACYNAFTAGQRDRMEFFILQTRESLLNSDGCQDPCTLPVTASFTASAGPLVPVGTTVLFSNTSLNGLSFEWSINGTPWANTPNTSYLFGTIGQYVVQLTIKGADPNCSGVFSDTLTVFCPLLADFTQDNPDPLPGATVTFSSQAGNADEYEWTVNGLFFGATPTLSITLPTAADYAVCLTVADDWCQQTHCAYLTVEDTIPCPSAFIQEFKNDAGLQLGLMELDWLSGGDLFAGGYLPSPGQNTALARLSKNGAVLQAWAMKLPADSPNLLMELAPVENDRLLGLLSTPDGAEAPEMRMFKFDPVSGNLLWNKQFDYDYAMSARLAFEHPVSHTYWVSGRIRRPDLPADQVFWYDVDPATGNVLAQHLYSNAELPFSMVSVAHNGNVYVAGELQGPPNSTRPYGVACLAPDGSVLWSKQYSWANNGFGTFCEIQVDGNDLVVAGYTSFNEPVVMKLDLNGNVLWTRRFSSTLVNSIYGNGEPVHLRASPGGYLLTTQYLTGGSPSYHYMVFYQLDKQGNYVGSKMVRHTGQFSGIDVVSDDSYQYTLTGAFSPPTTAAELVRIGLDLNFDPLCQTEKAPAFTPFPSTTTTVSALAPQEQPILPLKVSVNNILVEALAIGDERICEYKFCTEYCQNGLDDDGDGYVDCYDVADCPCLVDLPPCSVSVPDLPHRGIGARLAWENPTDEVNLFSSPAVANMNPAQDNIPEIIVARSNDPANPGSSEWLFFRGDGADAASPARLLIPGGFENQDVGMPSIGDLNNDGVPELVFVGSDALIRVYTGFDPGASPAMQLLATAQQPVKGPATRPYLADFDADGRPEIYAGNDVFVFDWTNAAAPVLSRAGGGGPAPYGKRAIFNPTNSASPVASDLLRPIDCGGDPDCNGLEIAAGYGIYSVDLDPLDGDPVQIKLQKNLSMLSPGQIYSDGFTSVADIDLDGIPDVLAGGRVNQGTGVYAWNKTGLIRFFALPSSLGQVSVGMLAVANVYDDTKNGFAKDLPEILVVYNNALVAFNLNQANLTPAQPYWWILPTSEESGISASTSFDFDGDGLAEIVYRDQDQLRILYGGPAPFPPGVDAQRNWATLVASSGTNEEYPVVADVDNDGQAEIVVTGGSGYSPNTTLGSERGRLKVIEADPLVGSWLPTRPIWNQFNYFSVNVNDDLRIPKTQQPALVELPGLGSGKRPLNRFLGQLPLLDEQFDPYLLLTDAVLTAGDWQCLGDSIRVELRVCNQGAVPLPTGTPLRVYRGDPIQFAASRLAQAPALPVTVPVDSCLNWTVYLPVEWGETFYFVLNDDGSQNTPIDTATQFPLTAIVECDYSNNLASVLLPAAPPALELGPDVEVCQNGVWVFKAGAGFASYQWSTLSTDSSITVFGPGTYWVETRDLCGRAYSDTVRVSIDAATVIELGADTLLCPGSSLQLSAPGFTEYQWSPAEGLSCFDCPSPLATPLSNTSYSVLAKTALGCYSVDSIRVSLAAAPASSLDTALCAGTSLLWDGADIPAGSSRLFTYPSAQGCDSTLLVTVGVLPLGQTQESRSICAGDSSFIFGNWETAAGTYTRMFSSVQGCDSTHTVTLEVLPEFQTQENRSICAGDSSLIFDNWETAAGSYVQTVSALNGCDSTHTVTLAVLPVFQTTESRSICAGDSSLIFGNWETVGGAYVQTVSGLNGCDSTHTVTLAVLPVFQTTENRSVCAGDSSLIFGQWETAAGVYAQTVSALNGCDSTHTVTLAVLPNFQTTENRSICVGDSSLIFGQWATIAGTYTGMFSSAQGCDSVHTVVLSVLPVLQTQESRSICAGDSSLIFGNWETTAGTYAQTFQALGGCDSVHTILLSVLSVLQTQESRSICAGDSSLIFGQWETMAGSYLQTAP